MKRLLTLVLAGFCLAASAQAPGLAPALGCIPLEKLTCGCQIKLPSLVCSDRKSKTQPHLFTEISPDARLLAVLDGEAYELAHVSHTGTSVKGDPPGRSVDHYASGQWRIELTYEEAPATCAKAKVEQCEFTDVRARVRITRAGKGVLDARGVGSCGC